ncbi:MAG TPA: efflux RND transporter periplasmic adaptor subunit [Candidatus Hydrogenedentes bacterium]|nr:efflux RND transporter periplasmic adaptor subunit [Candidatus Hydrogenedentota bacterium]
MKRSVLGGLALAAVWGLGGCGGSMEAPTSKASPAPAAASASQGAVSSETPVETGRPERGSISAYYETTSRIQAETFVDVVAKGVGRCVSTHVEEGDRVAAGALLAELDKQEAQAALGQAEVQVRQTKSKYEIARKSVVEGLMAPVEEENARFAYEQALAAREVQSVQLANLTVRAPISGIVTKKNIQIGMLVSSGAPAYTIVDPGSYRLVINPPEKLAPRLRLKQEARVSLDAVQGEDFSAIVERINPAVDSASGTVKVTLGFDRAMLDRIKEGAFARVRLVLETKENALLVPKDAVGEENARKYVFRVRPASGSDGDRLVAERVDIAVGLEDSNRVEVLSGVSEEDSIVVLGLEALKPGTPVRVTDSAQEIAQSKRKADEAASSIGEGAPSSSVRDVH